MSEQTGPAKDGLKSELGLFSAISIVVGVVLGAGAFMKPPAVLAAAGDSTMALVAWSLGGLFSAAGGLTLCELGAMFPRTGGIYIYLEEVFGEKVAFLYGWMITFLFGPATIGALTGYFSSVFCLIFDIRSNYTPVVGAAVLCFVAVINSISVKAAGRLQMAATACKLVPIALLTVFGLWKGNGQVLAMSSGVGASSFSVAVLATLFAYDGWAQVASLGGEIKNPARILPRAIIGGLTFLVVVYISINVALLKVLPADQMVALGHDASSIAAQRLFGLTGGNLISVGIMIAMIGGLNGYAMTLSRILYTMGLRGQMPGSQLWSKIDGDSNTPVGSILFLLVLAFFYSNVFDADNLSNIASFSNWIFYMLTFVAVMIARRTHAATPRPYKVPLYPLVPLFAIGGALYVFYGMLTTQPANAALSIGLTLIGLPVFLYMKGKESPGRSGLKIKTKYVVAIYSLAILFMLAFSIRVFDIRPELRVATEPALIPFAYQENGKITGFDIDLMNAVGNRAGLKIVYVPTSFENIFEAVRQNYVDAAIASISVTKEREALVGFSQAYMTDSGLGLLVKPDSPVRAATDLSGKAVGVYRGSTAEIFAGKIPGAKIQSFYSKQDMAAAFNLNIIAAVIDDKPMLESMMARQIIKEGKIVQNLSREEYAIAVAAGNKPLSDKLNKALDEMKKNGELEALYKKWFVEPALPAGQK